MSTATFHAQFFRPTVESQDDVATKDDIKKLQGQMGTLLGIIGKLNLPDKLTDPLELPNAVGSPSRKSNWIWTRLVPVIAVIVALVAWLEPRFRTHHEQDLRNAIKIEVGDQLKEPLSQLNNMRVEIGEIQGELKRISFNQLGASDEKMFATSLPYLRTLMTQSASGVPQTTLFQLASKLRKTPESSKDYWPTVLQFIQFASSAIGVQKEVPPPGRPNITASGSSCIGPGYGQAGGHCLTISGEIILLDGGSIPGSRFHNCRIIFTQNPVQMHGVVFVNCVFEMPITSNPTPYLKDAARQLLASNLKSVSMLSS